MNGKKSLALMLGLIIATPVVQAETARLNVLELSLEELMSVVVTSVSRKAQTLADTAAAAYVIQSDDIRRSGATNIPEALRLAPGVQVAAIGNNKWAVSIRGQADRFSNKLLVLVDGRSVYSPMFSGVVWETLDVPVENIERIEVIRGPGASIWGANAVNGVINIITQSAFDSQGGLIALAAGSVLRDAAMARYSWSPDTNTAVQLHAKLQDTDPSRPVSGGAGVDDWHTRSTGFKVEHLRAEGTFQLQGGLQRSRAGDELLTITPTAIRPLSHTQRTTAGHLLGRWESRAQESGQDSLQVYLENSDYDHIILNERRTTLDLEYQQRRHPAPGHDLTWGVGYRYSQDKIGNSSLVTMADAELATSLYSVHVQDEITLQPQRWRLTLGARLEHNGYTGFEFQPNARLLWTPDAQTSAWISAWHAIRTPSRVERGGTVYLPVSAFAALQMDNGLTQKEKLAAIDFGWRHQFGQAVSLDVAGFYYRYDKLRDAALSGAPIPQPGGYVFIPTHNSNANQSTARGLEVSMDWRPRSDWRMQAAYSYLDAELHLAPGRLTSGYADTTPSHMLSLRSSLDLSSTLRGDAWLRRVGKVDAYAIAAYTTLDLRLAWQPVKQLELSLVGQNLLDSAHQEYGSGFILSTPSKIARSVHVEVSLKL